MEKTAANIQVVNICANRLMTPYIMRNSNFSYEYVDVILIKNNYCKYKFILEIHNAMTCITISQVI